MAPPMVEGEARHVMLPMVKVVLNAAKPVMGKNRAKDAVLPWLRDALVVRGKAVEPAMGKDVAKAVGKVGMDLADQDVANVAMWPLAKDVVVVEVKEWARDRGKAEVRDAQMARVVAKGKVSDGGNAPFASSSLVRSSTPSHKVI
jgi:hypothetical protein